MAFPGDRLRQKHFHINASALTGALNYDFPLTLTEQDFAEDDLTLGGEFALDDSLMASKDELGQYPYAFDRIRVDLNADYTLSKVEVVVRIPVGEISTLDGADVWLWWQSTTDTAPAVGEDFGQYDVYNAVTDSTGTSVPFVTWSAISMDENPASAVPQFKDRSGNSRHAGAGSGLTVETMEPGRGVSGLSSGSDGIAISSVFAPGYEDWSIIQCVKVITSGDNHAFYFDPNWRITIGNTYTWLPFASGKVANLATSNAGSRVVSLTRSGNNGIGTSDELSASVTGLSTISYSTITGAKVRTGYLSQKTGISMSLFLYCAPNIHWLTLLSRTIHHTAGTITPSASNVVGLSGQWTTIIFDGVNPGTEVRVFESPHVAVWELDYDGADDAAIGADYVDFDVVTSTTTDRHYIWWTTDPELAGATGHQVTMSGGETDAQLAALACAVIDGVADISATVTGTVITVSNANNGLTSKPVYHGLEGVVTVLQIGGTATTEIDGIEESTGDSFTADILVDSPREVAVKMLSIAYENVMFSTRVTQAGLSVPAGAMQREDANYANPS